MNFSILDGKNLEHVETGLLASDVINALAMSLVAGLSTVIGGCVVFCVTSVSPRVLAFSLALAGGVMTSVTILELVKPVLNGEVVPVICSLVGGMIYVFFRSVLPENGLAAATEAYHKRELHCSDDEGDTENDRSTRNGRSGGVDLGGDDSPWRARQWRLGVLMMATLTAHNLPEGVAVAVGALHSKRTGFVVMSAISMHNVPEGLAVAIPIYAATGSRWCALGMTLVSGLSEPLGAGLGLLVLRPILTPSVVDNATCAVGGVMLTVSVLELFPESIKYQDHFASAVGFVLGWLVISITVRYA